MWYGVVYHFHQVRFSCAITPWNKYLDWFKSMPIKCYMIHIYQPHWRLSFALTLRILCLLRFHHLRNICGFKMGSDEVLFYFSFFYFYFSFLSKLKQLFSWCHYNACCPQRRPWLLASWPLNTDLQFLEKYWHIYVTTLYLLKTDMSRFSCPYFKPIWK